MSSRIWHLHAWRNLLQTLLLIFTLFGIAVLVGFVLFGEIGLWIALAVSGIAGN
jgi:heat shock protein HtpX